MRCTSDAAIADMHLSIDHQKAVNEVRILFRLVHPNILRVRDIFEKRSQMCTIFERTDGCLLDVMG